MSVVDACGQYLYEGAREAPERSKVLIIIGDNSPEIEKKINGIIDASKARFDQEPVMVIQKSARQTFR